jgi:anti-sigma regulatory factor (Ser/Thr protein kinase)
MAEHCGFAEDEAQFIILAVDEACANVIRHAYQGRTDGEIGLSCSAKEDRIEFLLVDQGRSPRPDSLQPRPLEEVRPGGLGTHLIRSVMDEVRYRPSEQGNELFLAKSLRPRRRVETGAVTE